MGFDTARVVKLIKTYPSVMNDPKIHANPNNYARFYFHEIFPEYVLPHTPIPLWQSATRE